MSVGIHVWASEGPGEINSEKVSICEGSCQKKRIRREQQRKKWRASKGGKSYNIKHSFIYHLGTSGFYPKEVNQG